MTHEVATAPMTIRTTKKMVSAIDTLAGNMERSRNYVVNQAIEQYLEANTWQVERIEAGVEAAREGRVQSADKVFATIAGKHGWNH